MRVSVKKWGINGEGIAYVDKKATFIPGAIVDEEVEITITEEKEKYNIAQLEEVIEPSKFRRFPFCSIWKECGGCSLMAVNYKGQCKMKESILKDSLNKYAHYSGLILPIVKNPEPLNYRNSCKLPFGKAEDKIVTGMYERNSNSFVPLERCYTHSREIERVRKSIEEIIGQYPFQAYDKNTKIGLRTLVLKEYNQKVQVVFVTGKENLPQEFIQKVAEIENVCSIWQSIKTDTHHDVFGLKMIHLALDQTIDVQLNEYKASLLPRSFFQLNTKQAIQLYNEVLKDCPQCDCIVEAYSGIGAISLFVHDKAKKIIGIESVEDAVISAKENATKNNIKNIEFICGDAAQELTNCTQKQKVDCLIVDPPRSGLDDSMKEAILNSNIHTLIYVSCNPSTLSKDLDLLQKKYVIRKVQPFDMFSQTGLVETVVVLTKKKETTRNYDRTNKDRHDKYRRRDKEVKKYDNTRKNGKPGSRKIYGDRKQHIKDK